MPRTLTCEHCGKPFVSRNMTYTPKYCSKNCFYEHHRISTTCAYCGKPFITKKAWNCRCCCQKCSDAYSRLKWTRPCAVCGKPFSTVNKYTQTCSRKCGYVLLGHKLKGALHPSWKGKHRQAQCRQCGKSFWANNHPKTGWSTHCSRACKDKSQRTLIEGKRNGRWTGGKSREPYPIQFNNRLKDSIRERDSHTCQLCGKRESFFHRLDIHHIDYNKKNLSPNNLISLCRSCNSRVNHRREYWRRYFKEVLKPD